MEAFAAWDSQTTTTTASPIFLRVLDGHPMKYEPGERFNYSNGGYVVLALLAERASGMPFHDLVDQPVCVPAGSGSTTPPARSPSTGSTPASGSSRSANPVNGSPTPSFPTRAGAPGRSANASASWSR